MMTAGSFRAGGLFIFFVKEMINIAIKLATSITYTADGSQTNFSVPFDYLRPSFVHVAVNDAEVSDGFTISNRMVMFDSAPAKDAVVHIYRSTPTTRLVSWADASILKAIDMTIAEVQQLHILEEANDWSKTHSIVFDEERGVWQGRNYRVSNVSDPTEAQDVVTKNYLENTEDSFVQRMNAIKTQTEQFANTAGNSKDSAYKSAQSASVSAASAAESARLAEGYKTAAETAKSDASLYAANAKTSAANATASKEVAQSAATSASNFATDARNSAGEAKTYKDNAKTYRDNAKTYMDNAKNYSENVNVFTPSVSTSGVLSWTNKAGLANPPSVNIKGEKGDQGLQGIQGVQGVKGDTGAKGDRGATGAAATIRIGTVTTGASGSEAVVTNVGTANDAVFNFTLPRGEKGADGGIDIDAELSDTSTNPVQNKVIKREFDELLLPDGTLSIPRSDKAYISKVASDSLSIINDITQTVIEQSADGVTWETLFDSNTLGAAAKAVYVNGLHLGKSISITKGYVARITFDTHDTDYFSTIAMHMVLNDDVNGGEQSYKWYAGFNNLSDAPRGEGAFSTFGSTPSATFGRMTYNKVRYVFNEDKKAVNLLFLSVLCKGTVPYRSVLKYDSNKKRTVTGFPIEAPSFMGNADSATKATQDGDGKVISTTYAKSSAANTWEEQQDFKEVKLGYEKYLSRKISNTGSRPTVSLMQYEATGAFTLDLSSLSTKLQINESTVFTAYIASSADYPLTITNAGTIKYIGSASDVAITSAGLLLNILMIKDASATVTSIVQASKLEGGA